MGRIDTKTIVDEVVSRTIAGSETVSFRLVSDSRIPGGIKGFLLGRLLEKHSRGASEAASGGPVFEALLRTLALGHRYPRAEYLNDLDAAADFLSAYLIRPRESLVRWIFGDSEEVPISTVKRKTAFVADYRYLLILLDTWVRKHRITGVSREKIRSLISAFDDKVVAKHSEAELGLLARPIFGFVNFGSKMPEPEIPLELLGDFYREKKLDAFWSGIEQRLGGARSAGFASFMRCIRELKHPSVKAAEVVSPQGQPEEAGADQLEEPVAIPNNELEIGEPAQPVIPRGVSTLPDLSSCISDVQKERFVNAIFERDKAYYSAVVTSLNSLVTWKEAALFLSQFYQTNGLDPFADEVVEFTDAVHSRYDRTGLR